MKYTVEYYNTVLNVWDGYDEFCDIIADSAEMAIELAIDWCVEHDENRSIDSVDDLYCKYNDWWWRAAEITTENGITDRGEWVVK